MKLRPMVKDFITLLTEKPTPTQMRVLRAMFILKKFTFLSHIPLPFFKFQIFRICEEMLRGNERPLSLILLAGIITWFVFFPYRRQ
ncbi:hypothetical protein ERICV_05169 (plasmid) [Paenibacillus larvae subsp. larvae]|uniref:Uncharacterized protein n=1 Tax=Paenibacillus larvae subsp. larvae TaxID=147375 RepID=A0A6C0QZM7_9BACL|nr:hypothetical protein ERICV_05169 [Paenibacillus larvae subsp. larvae]